MHCLLAAICHVFGLDVVIIVFRWSRGDLRPLQPSNRKHFWTAALAAVRHDQSFGTLRADALLPQVATEEALYNADGEWFRAASGPLLGHQYWPDPLHIIENVSSAAYRLLVRHVPRAAMAAAMELLRQHCGIVKLTGLVPSHRWRLCWAAFPVVWAVALAAKELEPFGLLCWSLAMVSATLYARPERRRASSWLRLIGASYYIHQSFVRYGEPIRLSEHLLWPHCAVLFGLIDGLNISCERHESLWRPVREAARSTNWLSSSALTDLTVKVILLQRQRAGPIGPDRDSRSARRVAEWHDRWPCPNMRFSWDAAEPLRSMLSATGFIEGRWWHRVGSDIELRTSDAQPTAPYELEALPLSGALDTIEVSALMELHDPDSWSRSASNSASAADALSFSALPVMSAAQSKTVPIVSPVAYDSDDSDLLSVCADDDVGDEDSDWIPS